MKPIVMRSMAVACTLTYCSLAYGDLGNCIVLRACDGRTSRAVGDLRDRVVGYFDSSVPWACRATLRLHVEDLFGILSSPILSRHER